ncbi:MAG: helix-turn-helix domain-containing protein [Spirochaetes bacterium]|nr:helix-turn-helix domain-containing protein [Spirochaetota bacterium]
MDSLGEYLKEERLKLKVNLHQIAKETNISLKYLEAIENDEYSAFPGEAYLKGFLRTYCRYIGLDPDEVINKYDRIKIAETPTPIEKLIPKPTSNLKSIIIIMILIIVPLIIAGMILIVHKSYSGQISDNKKKIEKKTVEKKVFEILEPGSKVTFDLKVNNTIIMKSENGNVIYKIKQINPYVIITDNQANDHILFQDKLKDIDFDNNNINDVGLLLNNWDNETANITFSLYSLETALAANTLQPINAVDNEVLLKKDIIEDIKLNIKTISGTYIKYKTDDHDEVETFYNPNTDLKIEAKNRLIVWLSNAGSATFNLKDIAKEYIPGNPGEIAVKVLEWKKNNSGEYELQIGSLN